ncbi:MAG: acyltransferase family protein [Gordonia sp. (in: high G+C Gram-positive bacteria)]|uniref:acyltransferase family protein n=1 Tax=Gordonia sp. (in: high G+C Gram-positive bacteria) TaxID=84139 RepID=UPI0039E3652E
MTVTTPASRTVRRTDVEGLRGIAIMLVVVFHIWFGTVSGGVDAFLFISGFFLIPSLIRSQTSREPVDDPLPRLWRILKRLWIPMALVVAVTVPAAWFVYPSSRRSETLVDALWSDLFAENWALGLRNLSYADATSMPSPFQQLWSLAVQAQVFALLIVGVVLIGRFLRRRVRRGELPHSSIHRILVAVIAATTVASFGWATHAVSVNQTLNYYNTLSRFWEIALGGLVGLAVANLTVPGRWRQLAGIVGLAMLFATGLVVDGAATFPGPAALLPIGGTLLVFLAGTGGSSITTRALSWAPMVRLGALAFPLYLWHWPLLMTYLVYRNHHGTPIQQVGLLDGLAIIALSLLLAVGTDALLTDGLPRRHVRFRTPAVIVGTVAALVVAVQAGLSSTQVASIDDIDWTQHPGASARTGTAVPSGVEFLPRAEVSRTDLPQSGHDGCVNTGVDDADLITCDYGAPRAPGRKVLMLLGGSHAEHYLPALDVIGKNHDFTVETVLMVGCSLATGPTAPQSTEREHCRTWQDKALEHAVAARPDAVFTTSTRPREKAGPGDYTPQWYIDVFARLSSEGIPVIGVRDLPWLLDEHGEHRQPFDCMSARNDAEYCGVPRARALAPENPAITALGGMPGVTVVDFTDAQCDATVCPAVVGNVLVYRDSHHYTRTFVLTMIPEIEHALGHALGWFPERY